MLYLHDDNECYMQSVAETKFLDLFNPIEDDMQVQCLPVAKSDYPRWMYRKVKVPKSHLSGVLKGSRHGVGSPVCSHITFVLKTLLGQIW